MAVQNQKPKPYQFEQLGVDLSIVDITGFIQLDPKFPYPIGCGVAGEVSRGLYNWTDPNTLRVFCTKVALKQLVATGEEQQRLEQRVKREVATWRFLQHPNVTQFHGIAYVRPGRPPCLVSPYLPRNDILAYIGRHPELKLEKAREIAAGVQYLHSQNIVHGDLKADNVLVSDQGIAQINDFGMSAILDTQGFTTKILRNVRFNAPELMPISEEASNVLPTFKSDIFSLGILFLQLFHGPDADLQSGLPYNQARLRNGTGYDLRLLRRIHAGERPLRERYNPMSDQQWALLCTCWQGDPAARPDITWVANVALPNIV
jgi:serine/threonine protein kinase